MTRRPSKKSIQVFLNYTQDSVAKVDWDGAIIPVGRIPSVGEFIRTPHAGTFEVSRMNHDVNPELDTVARLILS